MRNDRPNRVGQVWESRTSGLIWLVIGVPTAERPTEHVAVAFALDGTPIHYDMYEPDELLETYPQWYARLS